MLASPAWFCAMWLLASGPAVSLLPGDGSLATGPGPWQARRSTRADQPAIWRDGQLLVPAGNRLGLADALELGPGRTYTLACRAAATSGHPRLRLAVGGQSAEFVLAVMPTTYQLTFRSEGEPDDPPLRVDCELAVGAALGDPAVAALDDLRLVSGAQAVAVPTPPSPVGVAWSEPLDAPLWLGQDTTVTVRTVADAGLSAGEVIWRDLGAERAGQAADRRVVPLSGAGPTFTAPVPDLEPGFYELTARLTGANGTVSTRRWVPVLRDLTGRQVAESWLLDTDALDWPAAAALGLRRVRRVAAWRDLVDGRGEYRWRELDADLRDAQQAGLSLTLALDVAPADRQPRGVATRRDGQPDFDRFVAFVDSVTRHCAGRRLIWELDDRPQGNWPLGDYVHYLARFAELVHTNDPGGQVAGLGSGFAPKAGGRLLPYLGDGLAKGAADNLDGLTLFWPQPVGLPLAGAWSRTMARLPEDLAAALGELAEGRPPLALVAPRTDCGPLEEPLGPLAPSPWQVAARTVRDRLLSLRASATVTSPSGWCDGPAPLSVALNRWLERFAGARFIAEHDLGAGLRALSLALPDGRGLAAVWNERDQRYTPFEPPSLGSLPRLRLAVDDATAQTLFGGAVSADDVVLGFDPLFLVGPDADTVGRWLDTAGVLDWRPTSADWRLAVRDGQPGMLLRLANGGRQAAALPLAVRTAGELRVAAERITPLLPPGPSDVFMPFVNWPANGAGNVRLMAEAGDALADISRVLWQWPARWGSRLLRADGETDDWADEAGLTAATEDHVASGDGVEWNGPDDAALTVRGDWRDGQLWLCCEVADERITGGDALEISLDLDPASPPTDSPDTEAEQRLRVRPWVEERVLGACSLQRLEPDQPKAFVEDGMRLGFRATPTGWVAELCLPLTEEAARRLEGERTFGLQATLIDDDGDGRTPTRLALLGAPSDEPRLPQVWLGDRRVDDAEPPGCEPAPYVARWPLDGGPGSLDLTPDRFGGAAVGYVTVDDWIRGSRVLRVARGAESAEVSVLARLRQPGPIDLWLRAWPRTERTTAPRVGLRGPGGETWWRPTSTWCRASGLINAAADLVVEGQGTVELAELVRP